MGVPRAVGFRAVAFGAIAVLGLTLGVNAASAATTVSVPGAIDASGGTDVTQQLVSFFATVPAGATVEFPDNAKYRIEGVLQLDNLKNVTLAGNGAQLFASTDGRAVSPPAPRFRAHWPRLRGNIDIQRASSLTLRDLVIRGPNSTGKYETALEGQAGITIAQSSGVVLDHVSVADTFGDGVYVAGVSNGITVRDSTFDTIGRQGVAIVNASNVVVQDNTVRSVARSAFDIEPASPRWSAQHVHIQGNTIGDYGNFALAAGGAGAGVGDVWFQDNHVTGGNGIAVYAGSPRWVRQGLHIIGNRSDVDGKVVSGTGRPGVMQLIGINGVEIVGNQQRVAANAPAVTLDGVCGLVMHDNEFPGAAKDSQVVAACGAISSPAARGTTAAPGAKKRSGPAGVAVPASRKKGSTDSTWLIVGGVLSAVALAVFVVILARERRRSTA